MTDWLYFQGRVQPMEWGRSIYTILPLPEEIASQLAQQNARRVEIELNDHPFNLALTKAPVIPNTFVYTGKSVLKAAEILPGDDIDVRLRKADPDAVDVPNDVIGAVREAGMSDRWATLTAGKQRGLLHPINSAKRPQTRSRRIEQLVESLRDLATPTS